VETGIQSLIFLNIAQEDQRLYFNSWIPVFPLNLLTKVQLSPNKWLMSPLLWALSRKISWMRLLWSRIHQIMCGW